MPVDIDQLILDFLRTSDTPVSAKKIAKGLRVKGFAVSRKDVNSALYGSISSLVTAVPDTSKWIASPDASGLAQRPVLSSNHEIVAERRSSRWTVDEARVLVAVYLCSAKLPEGKQHARWDVVAGAFNRSQSGVYQQWRQIAAVVQGRVPRASPVMVDAVYWFQQDPSRGRIHARELCKRSGWALDQILSDE